MVNTDITIRMVFIMALCESYVSLNDLTEESGGTVFIPGTHKLNFALQRLQIL